MMRSSKHTPQMVNTKRVGRQWAEFVEADAKCDQFWKQKKLISTSTLPARVAVR